MPVDIPVESRTVFSVHVKDCTVFSRSAVFTPDNSFCRTSRIKRSACSSILFIYTWLLFILDNERRDKQIYHYSRIYGIAYPPLPCPEGKITDINHLAQGRI